MTSAVWTPENTLKLTTLWKEGRTAAWIARALGPGVSRSAVLGKVYRLGLARGPEARRARPIAREALSVEARAIPSRDRRRGRLARRSSERRPGLRRGWS